MGERQINEWRPFNANIHSISMAAAEAEKSLIGMESQHLHSNEQRREREREKNRFNENENWNSYENSSNTNSNSSNGSGSGTKKSLQQMKRCAIWYRLRGMWAPQRIWRSNQIEKRIAPPFRPWLLIVNFMQTVKTPAHTQGKEWIYIFFFCCFVYSARWWRWLWFEKVEQRSISHAHVLHKRMFPLRNCPRKRGSYVRPKKSQHTHTRTQNETERKCDETV